MKKLNKDLNTLYSDVKATSDKVIAAMNRLMLMGPGKNGEIDKALTEKVIDAHNEWRKAVDFYNAIKKQKH